MSTILGTSGAPAAPADTDLIKDSSQEAFAQDVIAASRNAVVLVDFWAPWCGPCRQLTPTLEKVVKESGGKVRLVKINVDENQVIAGQLGIQSIPAVFAFKDGQPVDGFMGALPESQIKAFLEGLVGPSGPSPVEQALEMAEAQLQEGNAEAAAQIFAKILQTESDNLAAIGGLSRAYLALGETDNAEKVLDMVPDSAANDPAITAARSAIEIAKQASAAGDPGDHARKLEANPNDHQARFDLAMALLAMGDREDAVNHLLEIVKRDRSWNDDGAREKLLQLFETFGPKDPITQRGRTRLSSLLFA